MSQEMVTVPLEEWNAMKATITDLKARLEKRMNNNIERLKAYKAAHPEKVAAATAASREAYNARRRELRRQKKEAAAAAAAKTPGADTAAIATS